ncbi:MAG: ATP-dependent helicase HrpB [Roseobacter sp.]
MKTGLPIDDAIPQVLDAVRTTGRVVLHAPPGAGKTTGIPLALLDADICNGLILMLEPRRLAARAAAERMAQMRAEKVGQTVGYRIRGQTAVSEATRIEVVTEGILTRMLQDTPDLPGVGAVIFDEFHERSLNADLGLALCLDVAEALRDDLKLVVMSATIDAVPVSDMIGAAVVQSLGRSYDVTERWLQKPLSKEMRFEQAASDLILEALAAEHGSMLVFLPGEGEIRRVEARLRGALPPETALFPLFGAMDFKAQRQAIAPLSQGRKVVLATAIAETSLTIEGIRIVVDTGRARRAEFDPGSGMSRLVTTRVSKAEATQRAGRAGRLEPGICYKLWTRGDDGALPAFPPAEIDIADLSGFALELANWGAAPSDLAFLSPPHDGRLAEARAVLTMLGALDTSGRITAHGRALTRLPIHPRLAHMLQICGPEASNLAALLSDRDIFRGAPVDIALRLQALQAPDRCEGQNGALLNRPALERVRQEAKRLRAMTKAKGRRYAAPPAALAYPDRIALRRPGDAPRYILSNGKGAYLPKEDPLNGSRLLVATDLDGDPKEARIRQAATMTEAELREIFAEQIAWHSLCDWSKRDKQVRARRQERFGALVLDDQAWRDAPEASVARAMLDGVRHLGLRADAPAQRFLARARLMQKIDPDFPDFSETHLMAQLEDWLLPFIAGITTAQAWRSFKLLEPLRARLDFAQQQTMDKRVPPHFRTPLGRQIPIDFENGAPSVTLRLQEVFGVTVHPIVAGQPLQMTLLSPAQRPVQITNDLPGFWTHSYSDVRKDMRGRYPKHPWPEDPTQAQPTLRTKPRQ